MALRTPDFQVPPYRPSLIEQAFAQAFGAGLQALVTSPFERAAERRTQTRQVEAEGRAFELFKKEQTFVNEMQAASDIRNNFVEATPDAVKRLQQAGLPPEDLSREYEARTYIPRASLVQADIANAALSPEQNNMITGLLGQLKDRGFPGPESGAIRTQRQLQQTLDVVNPEISLASLAQQDRLRQDEMRLAAENRQFQREQQFYGMLNGFDPRRTVGLGAPALDAQGNPTGNLVPLTLDQSFVYENPAIDIIASEQTAHGGVDPTVQHYVDVKKALLQSGVQPLKFITQDQITKSLNLVMTPNSPSMQLFAQMAMQTGIARDKNGRPLPPGVRWTEAAAFLATHPAAAAALIAAQTYHSMDDVLNAEKVPGAASLDEETLQYMQHIFRGRGGNADHPRVPTGGLPPVQRAPGDATSMGTPSQVLGGASTLVSTVNLAPPTSLISTPDDSAAYAGLTQLIAQRMRNDPTSAKKMSDYVTANLTTPEAAANYMRRNNMDPTYIHTLTTGTAAQRNYALTKFRLILQASMQDAHNDVFGDATDSSNAPQP